MYENLEKDIFSIMNRFRKLTMRVKLFEVSHGEFFMLGAIYSRHVKKYTEEAKKKELHPADYGIQISELNCVVKGSKSATSKMLKNLEKKGYIQRGADWKDKRNIYVTLTEEGEKIFLDAKRNMQKMSADVVERMGEADMKELILLFNKLYHIMEEVTATEVESEGKETYK